MTTVTAPRARTPEAVQAIGDPMERVAAAADLVRWADERAEGARAVRDMAAIVARLDDNVAAVTLYRDILQVSRGLFVRIMQRAPASRPSIDNAVEQARESADAVRRHEDVRERARVLRDETALLLMSGGADPVTGDKVTPVSNADIARATSLSTARIAQVRTGTR